MTTRLKYGVYFNVARYFEIVFGNPLLESMVARILCELNSNTNLAEQNMNIVTRLISNLIELNDNRIKIAFL